MPYLFVQKNWSELLKRLVCVWCVWCVSRPWSDRDPNYLFFYLPSPHICHRIGYCITLHIRYFVTVRAFAWSKLVWCAPFNREYCFCMLHDTSNQHHTHESYHFVTISLTISLNTRWSIYPKYTITNLVFCTKHRLRCKTIVSLLPLMLSEGLFVISIRLVSSYW